MELIAHRGASFAAPENSLEAFQRAIEQGADRIELDVRFTSDGVPVVMHDARTGRTLLKRLAAAGATADGAGAALSLGTALQHGPPPPGSATDALSRSLAFGLAQRGLSKLVPLQNLSGVSAELRRKGSTALQEEVRVWGAVAQVAQLGRCTQADTVLDIELRTAKLSTLTVAPADRQDYEQAHGEYRAAFEEAIETRERALREYRAAFEQADNKYRESGGLYSSDGDDPKARGVDARARFQSEERRLSSQLDILRTTLGRYPETPDDAVKAEIDRRRASGEPLGILIRARVRLVDVDTSQLLLLMDVDVAGKDETAAGEALASLVVERLAAGARVPVADAGEE